MIPPSNLQAQRPVIEALEPKLLYSADIAPAAFLPDAGAQVRHLDQIATSTPVQQTASHTEIVFIDASVPDLQVLLDDIARQHEQGRDIVAQVIKQDEDGIARITQVLAQQHEVTAIHLIGHGESGHMQMGASQLDESALLQHAREIASWGQALIAQGDILLYGCDLAADATGRTFVHDLATLTGADIAASNDLTGSLRLGADWTLEVTDGAITTQVALSAQAQAQWDHTLVTATTSGKGTAIFADSNLTAVQQAAWDGQVLGTHSNTAINANWTIISSAESPFRDEAVVIGISASGDVRAERWDGTQWTAATASPLATGLAPNIQGIAVGYEHISGDAMIVWNSGSALKYMVFNGTTWSAVQSIPTSAYGGTAKPVRMQMAAQPGGDSMALVVTDENYVDRALIWNGSSWGNPVTLDTVGYTAFDQFTTAVTYEALSGRAMVAYGKTGDANVHYRLFDGSSWTLDASTASYNDGGSAYYITLASDPHSNRIAMGLNSYNSANNNEVTTVSFAVWSGSSWGTRTMSQFATPNYGTSLSVGFESRSGDVLATFGNGTNAIRYQTWNSSTGWAAAQAGPNVGGAQGSIRAYADPTTNHVMVAAMSSNGNLVFSDWTGTGWGTTTNAVTNTGSTATPAYTWFWQHPDTNANDLWLGNSQDTTTWPGVANVSNTEVLALGGNNLQLGGTSQGSFSHLFDLGAFGTATLDDIAWISKSVSLGPGMTLQRGDVLFTVGATSTLSSNNSVTVEKSDLVLFRPDVEGQYDKGNFTVLIQGLGAPILGTAADVRGLAVVEENGMVGDAAVQAGDILYTAGAGAAGRTVYLYSTASASLLGGLLVGGTTTALIDGSTININQVITGLEVMTKSLTVKNMTLPAGSLLMSFEQNTSVAGLTGVNGQDVVLLDNIVTGTANSATATLLLDGSDLGMNGGAIDTLALHRASPPTISSPANIAITENATGVTTVVATDASPAAIITYRIAGGADASLFSINAQTGELRFNTAPNFEAPQHTPASSSNAYEVIVAASNDDLESTKTMTVTVQDVNEAPVINSNGGPAAANVNVIEEQTAVTIVHAVDPELNSIIYSLVSGAGGADNALFAINASTGALSFVTAPQYANRLDADSNNVYQVLVQASDGTLSSTQAVNVTVLALNIAPTNSGLSNKTLSEDSTILMTGIAVSDPDAGTQNIRVTFSAGHGSLTVINNAAGGLNASQITYSNGGHQVVLLGTLAAINTTLNTSGALGYRPDTDYNGLDTLTMVSDDLGNSGAPRNPAQTTDTDSVTFTITGENDAPSWVGNTLNAIQGGSARPNLVITDPDSPSSSWTISASSITAGHFVDTTTGSTITQFAYTDVQAGTIVFVQDGSLNVPGYTLVVSDGLTPSNPSTVTATLNATPVISSLGGGTSATVQVNELEPQLTRVQASDPENGAITYGIAGGADAGLFTIDSTTGQLRFAATPDMDNAPFQGHGLDYLVTVSASDGRSQDTQALTVHLNPYNRAPVNSMPASLSTPEDSNLFITGLNVSDIDANSSDAITVTLSVNHGTLQIAPNIASGLGSSGIAYTNGDRQVTLSGTMAAINATLAGSSAVRYTPDADYNGSDTLTMTSDDLGHNGLAHNPATTTDTDTRSITITAVNDAPIWSGNTLNAIQGGGARPNLAIIDADSPSTSWTITASNVSAGRFVDTTTGSTVTQFAYTDVQAGHIVFVQDGSLSTPSYALVVSDGVDTSVASTVTTTLNATPVISSLGGASTATVQVNELETTVTTVQASDAEGAQISYAIAGGADASLFTIDSLTGQLSFVSTPNLDNVPFLGHSLDYVVAVSASDGSSQDTQTLTVHLNPYNRAPVNAMPTSLSTLEDTPLFITGLNVTDMDANSSDVITVTFSVNHGTLQIAPNIASGLGSSGITHGLGDREVTLSGTVAAINATLADSNAVRYNPDADYNGSDTLTMTSDDLGHNGLAHNPAITADTDTRSITITAVNDAPTWSGSNLLIAQGGSAQPVIHLGDIDSPTSSWTVTASSITAGHFVDTTSGATITQFAYDDVQAGTIVFVQDDSLTAPSYTLTASDGIDSSAPLVVTASLNLTPVISSQGGGATANLSANELDPAVTTVQASDAEGAQVSYAIAGGADASLFTIDSLTGQLRFASTPDADRAPFLNHSPDYVVTVSASDGASQDTQTLSIHLNTYNRPPVNVLPGSATTQEDTPLFLTGLRVTDIDAASGDIIQVTLSVSHGTLSIDDGIGGGLTSAGISYGSDGRQVTLSGTMSAINATLAGSNALRYNPDDDYNGQDTLTMVSDDLGHNGLVRSPTDTRDTDALAIDITAVNDAPTWSANSLHLIQGGSARPVIGIADIDSPSSTWVITASGVTAGHFTDTTSGLSVTQFTFEQVQAGQIVFEHDGSVNTPGYTLTVSDGIDSASSTATISLVLYNRPPVNTLPGSPTTLEDTPLVISSLGVSDIDASTSDVITVTLSVNHGTLSVDGTVPGGVLGTDISYGNGSRQVTLSGTMSAINATLAGNNALLYRPDGDYNGQDTLTMVSDDLGHNGLAHNPQQTTDTDSLVLNITPVDDAPVVSSNTLFIGQGGRAAPQIGMVDVDSLPSQLTISAQQIRGGHFVQTQTQTEVTQFSAADLNAGYIFFVQDGSQAKPSYVLSVSDGVNTVTAPSLSATLILAETNATAPTEPKPEVRPGEPVVAPVVTAEKPAAQAPTEPMATPTSAAEPMAAEPDNAPPPSLIGNGFVLDTSLPTSMVKISFEPTPQREWEAAPTDFTFTPATSWNGFLQSKDAPEELRRNLEQLRDQLVGQEQGRHQLVASSIALTTGMSVGYVIWLVRGGALIGSMLSAMPMWQMIDPLPVLTRTAGKRQALDSADGDASVEQIFDGDHVDHEEPMPEPVSPVASTAPTMPHHQSPENPA